MTSFGIDHFDTHEAWVMENGVGVTIVNDMRRDRGDTIEQGIIWEVKPMFKSGDSIFFSSLSHVFEYCGAIEVTDSKIPVFEVVPRRLVK